MTPDNSPDLSLPEKEKRLEELLVGFGKVLIAFSGGVDSTFLLNRAVMLLGRENVLAVTAASPIRPASESAAAGALAAALSAEHLFIETGELSLEPFLENRPDRCYHCKKELCCRLKTIAAAGPFRYIVDGANRDDLSDYRPGAAAARASGIRSPLQEAALSKSEIRTLSRRDRLPTWNRPAESCLATRFPYGERLELAQIERVEKAESYLRSLGLEQELRVRTSGGCARIEAAPAEMALLWKRRREVVAYLREIGFLHAALDLEGYSPGAVNRGLNPPPGPPNDPFRG